MWRRPCGPLGKALPEIGPAIGRPIQRLLTLPPLEKLNGALVFRRRSLSLERAEVSAFPRLWIFLPRIQSILTGFQFPDHYVARLGGLSFRLQCTDRANAARL
jgi:hypothetical protein